MAKKKNDEPQVDLLGQLTVQLDAEYTLRPSRQAISNIEKALGKPLIQLATQGVSLSLQVEEMGVCVAELMKAYGSFDPNSGAAYKVPNPDRISDLIYEAEPLKVCGRLGTIFKGALTGGYTASGEPKAVRETKEPTPTAE